MALSLWLRLGELPKMPLLQLKDPQPDHDQRNDQRRPMEHRDHHALDNLTEATARFAQATIRIAVTQFSQLMEMATAWLRLTDKIADTMAHKPRVREPEHQGSYPGELTDDQVSYLHEAAAARRRKWMEHSRES
jgi:hypothetical protein